MRSPLLALLLTAALLSGCVVEEPQDAGPQSDADGTDGQAAQAASEPAPPPADPEVQEEATPAAPHGTPQWSNGTITTGTDPNQVPGAWARQDVSVSNGFGELLLGDLSVAVSAGSIRVEVADRADYQVRAVLEVRAASEEQARETLERTRLQHGDEVQDDTLVLSDRAVTDPAQQLPVQPPIPLPSITIDDVQVVVDIVVVLPLHPAVDAHLIASSGAISVSDLRGSMLEADTSSGGISIQQALLRSLSASASSGGIDVQDTSADEMDLSTSSGGINGRGLTAGTLVASASSGGIELDGTLDSIDASTSSGGIVLDAVPAASGKYDLSTSSGGIEVTVPADGHAYKVTADVSSGDIDIDVPGAKTDMSEDERHAEAVSPGYDDAELRTEINADASSGGIEVTAR